MYCKFSKERWRRTEIRPTAFCLQRVSHTHQESEWNTHKHTCKCILSNNMASIEVHFRDLVQLGSHQQLTLPDFTWTIPQTTLFKQTRTRFAGAQPRSKDSVHIIQTNRNLTSIEPGCAPNVLVWKHPKILISWYKLVFSLKWSLASPRLSLVGSSQSLTGSN